MSCGGGHDYTLLITETMDVLENLINATDTFPKKMRMSS